MAEVIAERVRRYILDGSDEDLRRLLGVAESTREMARSAFRRVGMQEGWHVIDCGCGPIGGLAVMAEMAGPAGRVVGIDFSEPAIRRARSVVAALQLGNVELFAGDIHELDAAAVGGPFDLAYTRFFLMHQPDPVRTLSQITRLLRPGGWVVAQEALRSPPPRSHPHLDALGAYWDLVYQVLERAGGWGVWGGGGGGWLARSASRPSGGPGRSWRRCSWATWSCLLVTSTSLTRPRWAARSTWLIRGFS